MRNAPQNSHRILVATLDVSYGQSLTRYLETEGYVLERCHEATAVLRIVSRRVFDVIVLDLEISEVGDVDLLTFIRRRLPDARVILLFDISKIDRAIQGIRRGAFFYLPRSSSPSDVALVITKAVRAIDTEAAVRRYEDDFLEHLIGGAPAMRRVVDQVVKVAPTTSTVLLVGESGTGKELMAHTIHRLSPRREMPFIAINCAALPEGLLESEMFGHVKGAFTGADSDKRGLFEEADGGTIFLDEIGDMALITQAKLLRVLQNGEIRRVGSSVPQRVDVRVIAATNKDLEKAVSENKFREDLYFRLNVVQIRIPPLRERMEALPHLVRYFISRFNAQYGKNVRDVDERARAMLQSYTYPGNIRELESIIAHAVIMCDGEVIRVEDLPETMRTRVAMRPALPNYAYDNVPSISQMEEQLIRTAMERLDGNQTEVARKLGISRSTLWRKMREYGIEPFNKSN